MRTLIIENQEEIHEIIRMCKTCYVAMSDGGFPYVLPMNFALDGTSVLLHSAQKGRMWDILKSNPRVCINWTLGEELVWQDAQVGCSYRVKSKSVLVEGVVEFVEDYDEKVVCMEKIMAQYSNLPFRFNAPSINNVGVIRVLTEQLSARIFGAQAVTPWKKPGEPYLKDSSR